MHKWVEDLFGRVVAGIIVAVLLALGAGFLAWVQGMPLYVDYMAIILTIGLVLFALNQISILKRERKKHIAKLSDKEIKNMIREWLDIPGFTIEGTVPEPQTYFNFFLKDKSNRGINIIRHADVPAVVLVAGRVKISSPKRSLNDTEWRKLAGKINIEMARLGIEYVFDGETNRYEFIRLVDPVIIDDSLTDFFIKQRIFFVLRAMVLVIEVTNQYLEELGPQA